MSRYHRQTHNRVWASIRQRVLDRDGHRCKECGKPGRLECHHKVHLQDGGTNDLSNLQVLCRGCHIQTHKKPLSKEGLEWASLVNELG